MGELFCVSEMFWYQKFLDYRVIGIRKLLDNKVSRFCRLFLPQSVEKFVENPPLIQKIRGPKKTMHKRGVLLFSVEIF